MTDATPGPDDVTDETVVGTALNPIGETQPPNVNYIPAEPEEEAEEAPEEEEVVESTPESESLL